LKFKGEEVTFLGWLDNVWYHFKWHTIGAIALIAVVSVMVVQCASREKYDFITVLYTHTAVESGRIEKIEEYIEQYAEDIDGDGKVSVQVVDCSFIDTNSNSQSNQAAIAKIQAMIAAEPKAVMYIFDDKGFNDLNAITADEFFEVEPIELSEDFYNSCEGKKEFEKLPEGLKLSYRRITNTMMAKDKTANAVQKVCKKVYEKLTKK
jgi:hypothetical protein